MTRKINFKKLLFIIFFIFTSCFSQSYAAPNYYEKQKIKQEVEKAFHIMIQQWQEELYFDLFDNGQESSQQFFFKKPEKFIKLSRNSRSLKLKLDQSPADQKLIRESKEINKKLSLLIEQAKALFAQRMIDLNWKTDNTGKQIKIKNIKVSFRNQVTVICQIGYTHKVNQTRKLKKEEDFIFFLEDGNWKYDLMQLIRTPY